MREEAVCYGQSLFFDDILTKVDEIFKFYIKFVD